MSNEDVCSCCQMRSKIKELEKKVKKLEELLLQTNKANNNHDVVVNKDEGILIETKTEVLQADQRPPMEVIHISRTSPFDRSIVIRDQRRKDGGRPKSYSYSIGDDIVVGIKEDVRKLVQQLISPKSGKFLAIVGMGGSGKTTLAKKIFNHREIDSRNECKAWICVSQTWDEHYLLREIHRQITGHKGDKLSVEAIVDELHKFGKGKSCLVVLDDVWQKKVLTKVMVPIIASSPGVKFIITTRNRKVVRFSNLKVHIHTPSRLTHAEMLELFQKITVCRNATFVGLAEKMLKKCDGLPLAVIVLAGVLGQKETIQGWMKVEKNVSSNINEDEKGPPDYGTVKDVIGLSFSELNHTLKSCFMYLGIFPEDAEIPTGMLMRCWIAEGFFKFIRLEETESVEDVAMKCLDELVQRCLVQAVGSNCSKLVRTVKVHDLLRNLAIKKAKRVYFFDTINSTFGASPHPSTKAGMTMHNLRLGVSDSYELNQIGNLPKGSPKIRSFVRFTSSYLNMDLTSSLFTNYPLLRVLILHDVSFKYYIPDEIGDLKHLRCFRLLSRFGVDLPDSMQNLKHLLILDYRIQGQLFGNNSVNIPNLKEMKHLTYLRLPRQKLPYDNVELNLHELRYLKVLMGVGAGMWMRRELKCISPMVEKLEIVGIDDYEELEMVYQCPNIVDDYLYTLKLDWWQSGNNKLQLQFQLSKLQHCKKLQKLHLNGEIADDVPLIFPPNLLELKLQSTMIRDRVLFAAALERLVCLRILFLADCSYEDSQLIFPLHSLLDLEHLHIQWCENLEEIQVMEGAIPNLRYYYISECDRLVFLPQCLRRLPHKFMSWKTLPPTSDD